MGRGPPLLSSLLAVSSGKEHQGWLLSEQVCEALRTTTLTSNSPQPCSSISKGGAVTSL